MNLGFLSDSDRETATVQLLGHSVGTCWRWSGNGKVHFMFPSDDSQTFSILLGHSSLPFTSLPSLLPSAVCVPLHTSRSLPLSLSLSPSPYLFAQFAYLPPRGDEHGPPS